MFVIVVFKRNIYFWIFKTQEKHVLAQLVMANGAAIYHELLDRQKNTKVAAKYNKKIKLSFDGNKIRNYDNFF